MRRLVRFWKIIILDTLGVVLMIAALLTGWLPGPGGIPLFLAGLGLLAINHEWAERRIELLKDYADRLGDLVFRDIPWLQATYDVVGLLGIVGGAYLIYWRPELWVLSVGVILLFLSLTTLLGNRKRFTRIKSSFRK